MSLPTSIDWSRVYAVSSARCFQEDPAQKQVWLEEAQKAFPVGSIVVLLPLLPGDEGSAHADGYPVAGSRGVVVGHDACKDPGGLGLWPWVLVRWFAAEGRTGDCGVYDDHIERVPDPLEILADALEDDWPDDLEILGMAATR